MIIKKTIKELRIVKNYLEESMFECDTVQDALNMIEGEELLAMLKEHLNEDGDIDDVLEACRDLIAFHINDVNKFFTKETRECNSKIIAEQDESIQEIFALIEHAQEELILACQSKANEHQDLLSVRDYLKLAQEAMSKYITKL